MNAREFLTPDTAYRWQEDERILTITAAPPGWLALFRKTEHDPDYNPEGDSIYDLAWVEPIACFALVEMMEREEISYGFDKDGERDWVGTGRSEIETRSAGGPNVPHPHWPHTKVFPVWLESGEVDFPGVDELVSRGPSLILPPGSDPNVEWVRDRLRPLRRESTFPE